MEIKNPILTGIASNLWITFLGCKMGKSDMIRKRLQVEF